MGCKVTLINIHSQLFRPFFLQKRSIFSTFALNLSFGYMKTDYNVRCYYRDGKMENAELDIDQMSEQLKRAQELIKFCKDKLTKTDEEIQKIQAEANS